MMHDRRPSELKIGAFLGLEGHFPVLGGHIPMKIPIGTEIPIGGSYPEIRQAGFRIALAPKIGQMTFGLQGEVPMIQ